MSRKSAKKPAVKRTRQLKSRPSPAVLIASAAAVVLAVVLIIVGIVVFTGKKHKQDQTPETTAPDQVEKVTQTETEETETEEISEAPEAETEAETMSPEDARYMEEAGKLVSQMPLEKKVSSLFITTPEALVNEVAGTQYDSITQAAEITKSAYDSYPVSGFLIQDMERESKPSTDSTMLSTLNTSLLALSPESPVLICVDEDYLKKIGQQYNIQETPGSRYTIDTGTLKELGFNVVFSGIPSENGSSSIRPSVQITADTADDISVLNVSDGFLSGYENIGQDGSSTYRTTAATGITYYRQEKNNGVLIVFEDGLYSAADTADELRKIGEEIHGAVAEGLEPVFLSRISDSDVSAADAAGADAGETPIAETDADGNPVSPSAPETDANGNPVPPSAPETDANGNPVPPSAPETDSNGNPVPPSAPETDANGNPVPPSPAGSAALTPAVRSLLVGADLLLCEDNFIDTLQSVVDAVNSGILKEEEIDSCATRVLAMRMKCFGSGMVGGSTDTLSQSENSGSQSESSADTPQSDSNAGAGTPQSDGSGASQSENSAGTPQSDGSSTSQSDSNAGTPQSDGSGTSQSDSNAGTPQSDGSGTSQSDANAGSPADGSTLPNGN